MQILQIPSCAVIVGENAVPVTQLPVVWQDIAQGTAKVRLSNAQIYVEMAQLFLYKLQQGDVDLFNERPELTHLKPSFCQLFGQLAQETLEFYGYDFITHNYPNFEQIVQDAESQDADYLKVARIGLELFQEFGYDLPASFYHVHLAPIYRDHIFEERALRFDKRDIEHKRSWDAILHAGKVFAMQMKVQSIASKYGFTYQHGCGCNSHLSSIDESRGAFAYVVYLISALLAGFAGLIETARLGMGDPSKVGINAEFDAIAAVVVGGTPFSGGRANVLGTVVGALLMQVISTSFNMLLIPFTWSLVLKSVIILFAIFLQRPKEV